MQTSTPILAPTEPEPRNWLGRLGTWPFVGAVVLYAIGMSRADAFWRSFGLSWVLGVLTVVILRWVGRS